MEIVISNTVSFSESFQSLSLKHNVTLPVLFTQNSTLKNAEHIFSLLSQSDTLKMRIKIKLLDPQLYTTLYQFADSIQFKQVKTMRSFYGRNLQFGFVVQKGASFDLPQNLATSDSAQVPLYYMGYLFNTSYNLAFRNPPTTFTIDTMYQSRTMQVLPYIPFFSNCKGFAQYIPLSSVFEQNKNCTLYPPESTVPITLFGFGRVPINSDVCNMVEIQCRNDEIMSSSTSLWYLADKNEVLFKITNKPISAQEMMTLNQVADFKDSIDLKVVSSKQSGKIPSTVRLTLNYYQKTKEYKELIQGTVELLDYLTPTNFQFNGTTKFDYKLQIVYSPMSHTSLIKAFALDTSVYLVCYIGICTFATVMIIIFTTFMYFSLRQKPRPAMRYLVYMKLHWAPVFIGFTYLIFPVALFLLLVSVVMRGHILDNKIYSLTPNCQPKDDCIITFFDQLFYQQDLGALHARAGRIGILLIIAGVYQINQSTQLTILSTPPQSHSTDFMGNIQQSKKWQKSLQIFQNFFVVFLMNSLINFSQSTLFAKNIYFFIGLLKPILALVEFFSELVLNDKLLLAPVGSLLGLCENFVTFGSDNLIAFLSSYIMGISISMFQRPFFNPTMNILLGYLEEKVPQWVNSVVKSIMKQDEQEEEEINQVDQQADSDNNNNNNNNESVQNIQPQQNQQQHEGDSRIGNDSEIMLYDESVKKPIINHTTHPMDLSLSIDTQEPIKLNKVSNNNNNNNNNEDDSQNSRSTYSNESRDEMEQELKALLIKAEKRKEDSKEDMKYSSSQKQAKEEQAPVEEGSNDQAILDEYVNFANDASAMVFFPMILMSFWLFYDETNTMASYAINKINFIYYFLFSVTMIPFQLFIDILFMNIVEQQWDVDFVDYLKRSSKRFSKRKNKWILYDHEHKEFLQYKYRTIDATCFSSQYYFSIGLNLSGVCFCIMGIQTICSYGYNALRDFYLLPFCIIWLVIIIFFQKFIMFLVTKFNIYHVNGQVGVAPQILQTENFDEQSNQNEKLSQFRNIHNLNINPKVEKIKNFNRAHVIKQKEQKIKDYYAELKKQKFKDENFRKQFIKKNKRWMMENLEILFSPLTLKQQIQQIYKFIRQRKNILQSFNNIYGSLQMKNKDQNEDYEKQKENQNINRLVNLQNKKQILSQNSKDVLRYWLYRSRRNQWIRCQIGGLMEQMTQTYCQFCGRTWGLRSESMDNIENMFQNFIKQQQKQNSDPEVHQQLRSVTIWHVDQWQNYFKEFATLRTVCYLCSSSIQQYHQNNKNSSFLKSYFNKQ